MRDSICHYTIVRLLPDPIAGEAINIGVAVLTATKVLTVGISKWDRVRAFAGRDATRAAQEFVSETLPRITEDSVRWYVDNAAGSVQFSHLLPSLEPPYELIDRIRDRYLKETVPD